MTDIVKNGATGVLLQIQLYDSTKTATNGGLTGLTNASAGLIIGTRADNETTVTAYTQAGGTIQTIATLGTYAAPSASNCRFKEIDATNSPGLYELQLLNGRFSVSSARALTITVPAVAGLNLLQMAPLKIPLWVFDPYNPATLMQQTSTESYTATPTTVPTYEQLLYSIQQQIQNMTWVGTTGTVKKLDNSTTAMTFAVDVAGTPTTIHRAT